MGDTPQTVMTTRAPAVLKSGFIDGLPNAPCEGYLNWCTGRPDAHPGH